MANRGESFQLVQVVCVHIKWVSAIHWAGLEGFHCIQLDSWPKDDSIVNSLSLSKYANTLLSAEHPILASMKNAQFRGISRLLRSYTHARMQQT